MWCCLAPAAREWSGVRERVDYRDLPCVVVGSNDDSGKTRKERYARVCEYVLCIRTYVCVCVRAMRITARVESVGRVGYSGRVPFALAALSQSATRRPFERLSH